VLGLLLMATAHRSSNSKTNRNERKTKTPTAVTTQQADATKGARKAPHLQRPHAQHGARRHWRVGGRLMSHDAGELPAAEGDGPEHLRGALWLMRCDVM